MSEMACKELVEVITAYLEGTLPEVDRRRFDEHLLECPFCTEYVAQMRATIVGLGRLEEPTIPADRRAELLAAFRGLGDEPPTT
jgi:anti-sigma factor RsiW